MATRAESDTRDSARLLDLADPERFHGQVRLPDGDLSWVKSALAHMILIRAAEEKIGNLVSEGRVRCPCHLAIGQEAPAVAVASCLRKGDRVFGAHRSHGHYLALGGSVHGLIAEVLGKVTGVSRGMGGSMHLLDITHGLYGTVPIVGATIPIAVGSALAAKMDGQGAVAVSFFGDGATEEGVFHESMNLAATFELPVLFFCENNLFSSHLHIGLRQPADSVSRFAEAHQMTWDRVDGNDVIACREATNAAVANIRSGSGPHFIEAVTYRWRGHVGPSEDDDVGVERQEGLARWKLRDPIRRLADAMLDASQLGEDHLEALWAEARAEVDAACEAASKDRYPRTEDLLNFLYTSAP
jgi:pyruvate dehydrogenase E1 component alpha subunit